MTWLEEMRAEHERARAEMRAEWTGFRQEIRTLIQASEARLVDRIHAVETTLHTKIDDRAGRLEVRIAETRADLMKWSLVFWVGAVGAIAVLAGVLRQ